MHGDIPLARQELGYSARGVYPLIIALKRHAGCAPTWSLVVASLLQTQPLTCKKYTCPSLQREMKASGQGITLRQNRAESGSQGAAALERVEPTSNEPSAGAFVRIDASRGRKVNAFGRKDAEDRIGSGPSG